MAVVALAASPVAAFDAQVGWAPVQSVAGYLVYVRQGGQPYGAGLDTGLVQPDAGGVVRYIVGGLPDGITNYFAVAAYDAAGSESALSNELALLVMPPSATATASRTATATTRSTSLSATATYTASRTATRTAPPSATRTPPGSSTPTATTAATAVPTASRTATPTATRSAIKGAVTIWGSSATPAYVAAPDGSAVELGVKFTADVDGLITGVRFYKGSTNTGTHTGTLWSSAGVLLARATFTNETASGWQQVNFSTPVAISAGTVYVASYHTALGHYAYNSGYFATAGFDNPPLHALRDGVSGGNGVFVYGASAFPTNTYQSLNYWVDVVFSANQPVTPTPTAVAAKTSTSMPTVTPTAIRSAPPTATRTMPPTPTASPTPSPTPGPRTTIWGSSATPAYVAAPDGSAVELGVKFTADVDGLITGVRFYKGSTNTGTHTGTLWSSAGVLLARATFTNETASGWQQVNFSTPVAISAGAVYVASYHTAVGHYSIDLGYFAATGIDRPPLHALRDGVSGGNGVFVYGASAFPTYTYQSSNYWVDVVFSATP